MDEHNPNPQWAITEATGTYLRETVDKAVNEGWSGQKLARYVREDPVIWRKS